MLAGIELRDVLVFIAGVVASTMGLYGIMVSRNLIRLLISMEVFSNSIVLEAAYIGFIAGLSPSFYALLIVVVALTIAEIAIVIALIALAYRRKKSLDIEVFRELKG